MTRICCICKDDKVITDFGKDKYCPLGYSYKCKACKRIYNRNSGSNTKRRFNKSKIYSTLVDHSTFVQMFSERQGKCDVCKVQFKSLCVDHCHTTGIIRGLLCNKCNLALGLIQDSQNTLQNAIMYLDKSKEKYHD
jgi:hypothetical protein